MPIFWSDPSVLFASTHEWPLYPGTGAVGERGEYDTIVNVPLPENAGSKMFREAVESKILPRVDSFAPDLIVVSAGFDAHRFDPIGGLRLEVADFCWITNSTESQNQGRFASRANLVTC